MSVALVFWALAGVGWGLIKAAERDARIRHKQEARR